MPALGAALVVAALLLPLSGCVAPDPNAPTREELYAAALQQRCSSFGFQPGTDAYADCVRREHNCERQNARYQTQLGAAIAMESSRPGASAGIAMGRAAARTPQPQCF